MILFLRFLPYVIAGVVGFTAAWQIQDLRISRRDASITQMQADHAGYVQQVMNAAVQAKHDALEREKSWLKEKENAQNIAAQREAKLKTELAAVRAASLGLRDDLAALRAGIAGSTESACHQTADTVIAVLSECQARYGAVAESADGHASDVQTLIEAWPK